MLDDETNKEFGRLIAYANSNGDVEALKLAADDIVKLRRELKGYTAFKRSVDEALNMGDGSYRP